MFLEITGFLADDNEDSSIKFELDVQPEFEKAVMDILGWENLAAECDGELPLTDEQGKHLGEFDPNTGEQTKPAKPGRTVEK